MGYERKTWMPGDYIYPDDLNHIEIGIEELRDTKAEKDDVGAVAAESDRHTTDLQAVHADLTSLHDAIDATNDLLVLKAEGRDVAAVAIETEGLRRDLAVLDEKIGMKVDQNELAGVAADIVGANAAVERMQSEMQFIGTEIAGAAAGTAVNAAGLKQLEKEMLAIADVKADIIDLEAVAFEVDQKASIAEIEEIAMQTYQGHVAALSVEIDRVDRKTNTISGTVGSIQAQIGDMELDIDQRVPLPAVDGETGQVLQTNGDGTTSWTDPSIPTDEQIGEAVSDWLDDHPEATTTVADGSITMDKLSDEVQEAVENGGKTDALDAQAMAAEQELVLQRICADNDDIRHQIETYDAWHPKMQEYTDHFACTDGIGFIYFTDPHNMSTLYGDDHRRMLHSLRTIRYIFENTPSRYVLCGGDWINIRHPLSEAILIGGRVPNLLRTEIGPDAYTVLGNHDNNGDSGVGTTALTDRQLTRMWFGSDRGYYILEGEYYDCYMLDVRYSYLPCDSYQLAEAKWFAEKLIANTKPHLFAVGHIIGGQDGVYFGDLLTSIMNAFNQRTSITVDGTAYSFANATGTFHFCLAGHYHQDQDLVINNIPVVYTDDYAHDKAVDCCYADFNAAMLYLTRIGPGEDREFHIIPNGGYAATN